MATIDVGRTIILHKGTYSDSANYEFLDEVLYNGSTYRCINVEGSTGNAPTNAEYWQIIVIKGEDGSSTDIIATEHVQALGETSGEIEINGSAGNIVTMTAVGATTITLTAGASATTARTLTLIITNGGVGVTWPASVKWADAAAPELTAVGTDVITLLSADNGITWYGVAACAFG